MITMIINYLTPFFIAWYITNFTPGQRLIDKLYEYMPDKLQFTREYLGCFKCMSFWVTLLMTFNPVQAMMFSMLAYTYNKIMSSLKMYI